MVGVWDKGPSSWGLLANEVVIQAFLVHILGGGMEILEELPPEVPR